LGPPADRERQSEPVATKEWNQIEPKWKLEPASGGKHGGQGRNRAAASLFSYSLPSSTPWVVAVIAVAVDIIVVAVVVVALLVVVPLFVSGANKRRRRAEGSGGHLSYSPRWDDVTKSHVVVEQSEPIDSGKDVSE
jgi:Flp pilus assembly protein TadB